MAAIERHENLHADARALFRERMAPGDYPSSCGLPYGIHLELPPVDKGVGKRMLG